MAYNISAFLSIDQQGYGKVKNEALVDEVLASCRKFSIKADLILLNTAMDSYIRFVIMIK